MDTLSDLEEGEKKRGEHLWEEKKNHLLFSSKQKTKEKGVLHYGRKIQTRDR